ncbi:MAG TPA: 16S rRNA (adenine(1518)-N(6)/adenine(1519)-N(6))-dimethyltransferase RsmA [bacterium]|nr:16S rRNA (adenine(1518)-N(6)/adenine(1519)-N(6))-dimethyltransferase RsmA [bacterium]HPV65490.1 16S rRNA (adenine(1518)-N(6)/adenine(1519)-N(6))-dimethyltransferase RsmA [bacterium]
MDLLRQTLDLCKIYNIKPEKSKGQNFLVDEDVYESMILSSDLKKDDVVLEVGPGLGILTFKISEKVKKVLAVELDNKLAELLNTLIISKNKKNIKIFNNDVLKIKGENIEKLGKYKIVANLPYNITSIFLRKFLSIHNKPEKIVLLLQKEVVDRIISKPPDMSLLAISVQFYAEVKKIIEVKKESFYPVPKIDSAIIEITPRKNNLFDNYQEEKKFFRLLKIGFSAKRKMLKNNLSLGLKIGQKEVENAIFSLGLDSKCRAEELSLDNWIRIFNILKFE